MILAISGKSQSGKDTIGKIIQYLTHNKYIKTDVYKKGLTFQQFLDLKFDEDAFDWKIKKFADKLKDIVCLLIGCTREQLENETFKNTELGEEWACYMLPHSPYPKLFTRSKEDMEWIAQGEKILERRLTPRLLLQLLGTNIGRNIIHPNIWCNSLFSDYNGDVEQWVDIKGYEGLYQISSFGNIKSLDRKIIYGNGKGEYHNRKGQLLKLTLSGGYKTVALSGITHTVHSLVAKHFLQQPNDKDYVVNHIDYNKENNFYKNLEWIKQGDNIRHNYKIGKANIGEKQKDAKLTDNIVLQIKDWLISGKYSNAEIARRVNVSPTTITDIKKGRKWKHVSKEKIKVESILPKSTPSWIITDVRFPNEAQVIKERNGIIIRVTRGQYDPKCTCGLKASEHHANHGFIKAPEHESETALDDYDFDYIIDNNGTIEELIEKVRQILVKEKII